MPLDLGLQGPEETVSDSGPKSDRTSLIEDDSRLGSSDGGSEPVSRFDDWEPQGSTDAPAKEGTPDQTPAPQKLPEPSPADPGPIDPESPDRINDPEPPAIIDPVPPGDIDW